MNCICGKKYNKEEFKNHFRNCYKFLEKYKNFDLKISQLIKKYFEIKNASIIKFLLQRYIRLIDHKINKFQSENNIRKVQSYEKNNKNIPYKLINPFYNSKNNNNNKNKNINNNININNIYHKNKSNNININNNNIINNKSFSDSKIMNVSYSYINNKIVDIDKYNINNKLNACCVIKKRRKISSFNLREKENSFKKCNEIIFQILHNKVEKASKQNFLKKLSFIGRFKKEKKTDNNKIDFENTQQLNYSISFIGESIRQENGIIIINYCKEIYIKNKGIINNDIVKSISSHLKNLFLEEFFIIISNKDNENIYFNLSSSMNMNKHIIFYLEGKKFYIISY